LATDTQLRRDLKWEVVRIGVELQQAKAVASATNLLSAE
jgi:hypothetical protein